MTYGDLAKKVPPYLAKEDSSAFIESVINKWVRRNLMLEKAEMNISEEDMDEIESQIEDYRQTLIMFKYEQLLIQQKLDTSISKEEIQKYYEEHKAEFNLDNSILRCTYIKVDKTISSLNKLRTLYWSEKE
jgi:hypothetical protein